MCPEPEGSQVLPPRPPSAPCSLTAPQPQCLSPYAATPPPTVCPQRGLISASLYSTPVTPPSSRTAHALLGRSEAFPSGIFTPNPGPHWPPTSGTAEPTLPLGPACLLQAPWHSCLRRPPPCPQVPDHPTVASAHPLSFSARLSPGEVTLKGQARLCPSCLPKACRCGSMKA